MIEDGQISRIGRHLEDRGSACSGASSPRVGLGARERTEVSHFSAPYGTLKCLTSASSVPRRIGIDEDRQMCRIGSLEGRGSAVSRIGSLEDRGSADIEDRQISRVEDRQSRGSAVSRIEDRQIARIGRHLEDLADR